jgi:putative transposase
MLLLNPMERLQAFKYELNPNGEQERLMRRFAGACRFVYNKALALQKELYERGERKLGYAGLCKELTRWRNGADYPWLADAPIHPQQQAFRDLDRAYVNFFEKRAEFPRFKKKGQSSSFRFPDPKQFKLDQPNSRIFLPKLGWVRYRNSREALGDLRNVTVSCVTDKWYVSVQTRRDVEIPVHPSDSAVGIDMGVVRFATLSTGERIEPINSFKKHQVRLARYQRVMARRQKFTNNWMKAKAKVQKIHSTIANVRRDFLHKTSATISKNHATVIVEDLKVRNMSASAKGTIEKPGKNVKQKSGLNRSILDQGWNAFRCQLSYKLDWQGGRLIAVPAQYTSQTCPVCGHVCAANREKQSFLCVECGFAEHADLVGAINILNRGLSSIEGTDSVARLPRRAVRRSRLACQASGVVMPPATGTRRIDLGVAQCHT